MDDLVVAEGRGERTQPALTGALRPGHVEPFQLADVVVLTSGLGLHDFLNHQRRSEITLKQLRQRFVTGPGIHDSSLTRGTDAGQKGRPFAGGRRMAATTCLRSTDSGVVGELVDLPDDRHLRPMAVVRGGFPHREQPRAECVHHRLVGVNEHLGQMVASTRSERDRFVQVEQSVAVVFLHPASRAG